MWWLQRTREKLRGTTRGPYSNGDLKRPHPFLLVVNLKWILQIQNRLPPTFSAGWTGHHRSICKKQNHHFTFSSFYISKFFKLFIYFLITLSLSLFHVIQQILTHQSRRSELDTLKGGTHSLPARISVAHGWCGSYLCFCHSVSLLLILQSFQKSKL